MKFLTILLVLLFSLTTNSEEYWLAFSQQGWGTTGRGYYIQLTSDYPQEVIISNSHWQYTDTLQLTTQTVVHRIPDVVAEPNSNIVSQGGIKVISEEPLQVMLVNFEYLVGGMTLVREYNELGSEYMLLSDIEDNPNNIQIVGIGKVIVHINPSVNTNIGNQPVSIPINTGEVVNIKSQTLNTHGLSGTTITCTDQHTGVLTPCAVFNNSQVFINPQSNCCADDIDHQEIPIKYWGTTYFVPYIKSKASGWSQDRVSDIKIIALEDNTVLHIDGQQVIMNSGTVVQYPTNQSQLVTAAKPIRVILVTRGGHMDWTNADPISMNILPLKYTQDHIVFKPLVHPNIQDHFLIVVHKLCNDFSYNGIPEQGHTPYNDSTCSHYYSIDTSRQTLDGQIQAYQYSFGNYMASYDAYGTELYTESDSVFCPQSPTSIHTPEIAPHKLPYKLPYNYLGQETKKYQVR